MNSQVPGSGVRKRFCDWALPEIWRSPNRRVAPTSPGNIASQATTEPTRTLDHRRQTVMPLLLLDATLLLRLKRDPASADAPSIATTIGWCSAPQGPEKQSGGAPFRDPAASTERVCLADAVT